MIVRVAGPWVGCRMLTMYDGEYVCMYVRVSGLEGSRCLSCVSGTRQRGVEGG